MATIHGITHNFHVGQSNKNLIQINKIASSHLHMSAWEYIPSIIRHWRASAQCCPPPPHIRIHMCGIHHCSHPPAGPLLTSYAWLEKFQIVDNFGELFWFENNPNRLKTSLKYIKPWNLRENHHVSPPPQIEAISMGSRNLKNHRLKKIGMLCMRGSEWNVCESCELWNMIGKMLHRTTIISKQSMWFFFTAIKTVWDFLNMQ